MVTMALLQGIVNAFVMFLARIIAYALMNRGSRDDRGAAPSFMVVWMLEIVLGVIGMTVVAWFSRQREFRADHGGATLAGKADMLAALRKLGANRALIDPRHEALATMKISGKWTGLFSTHPLETAHRVLEAARSCRHALHHARRPVLAVRRRVGHHRLPLRSGQRRLGREAAQPATFRASASLNDDLLGARTGTSEAIHCRRRRARRHLQRLGWLTAQVVV
jgi:hypothetical protein